MAIKHLSDLNLNNNQLQNVRIDVHTSDPTGLGAAQDGRVIYNSQEQELKYWSANATPPQWVSMKNTDVNVNKANLKLRLAELDGSETLNIGDDGNDTNVVIRGDLTVSGTTTTVNSATLSIADNEITLNSDVTGAPSENAGIEVNRGTSADVRIRWNETDDKWQFTNDGTNYTDLGGSAVDATTTVKGIVKLATNADALAGSDATKALTPSNLTAGQHIATIGNGALTSIVVQHDLGTQNVMVQIYDVTNYDTVYADVVRTDTNNVTISFATAPATGAYKVLITKIY